MKRIPGQNNQNVGSSGSEQPIPKPVQSILALGTESGYRLKYEAATDNNEKQKN